MDQDRMCDKNTKAAANSEKIQQTYKEGKKEAYLLPH